MKLIKYFVCWNRQNPRSSFLICCTHGWERLDWNLISSVPWALRWLVQQFWLQQHDHDRPWWKRRCICRQGHTRSTTTSCTFRRSCIRLLEGLHSWKWTYQSIRLFGLRLESSWRSRCICRQMFGCSRSKMPARRSFCRQYGYPTWGCIASQNALPPWSWQRLIWVRWPFLLCQLSVSQLFWQVPRVWTLSRSLWLPLGWQRQQPL